MCSVAFQRDCLNYIRVLQVVDDERLYVCGTYAFQPQCDHLVGCYVSPLKALRAKKRCKL